MALKNYKPNTPGLRQKTTLVKSEVTAQKPEKSLTISLHQKSGRDTFGRISVEDVAAESRGLTELLISSAISMEYLEQSRQLSTIQTDQY